MERHSMLSPLKGDPKTGQITPTKMLSIVSNSKERFENVKLKANDHINEINRTQPAKSSK